MGLGQRVGDTVIMLSRLWWEVWDFYDCPRISSLSLREAEIAGCYLESLGAYNESA